MATTSYTQRTGGGATWARALVTKAIAGAEKTRLMVCRQTSKDSSHRLPAHCPRTPTTPAAMNPATGFTPSFAGSGPDRRAQPCCKLHPTCLVIKAVVILR